VSVYPNRAAFGTRSRTTSAGDGAMTHAGALARLQAIASASQVVTFEYT